MEMDKILKSMETFQPERIKWWEATLPQPKEKLFEDMGKAMESAFKAQVEISLNIDPKLLQHTTPESVRDIWTVVARMCYKYIAISGGAPTERIK